MPIPRRSHASCRRRPAARCCRLLLFPCGAPGRVLLETMTDGSIATTFTMEPIDGGRATRLTLATGYTLPGGSFLPLLRWIVGSALRRVFQQESGLIARYIAEDRDLKLVEEK